MKNNKISEDSMTGIGTMDQISTSNSTSPLKNANKRTVTIKKKDLTDTNVQSYLNRAKDTNINVVDEEMGNAKLKYLSNVKDKDGKISQPFTIDNKRYQMVRVLTPTKEKSVGVYALDETDESGENIIYDMKVFEDTIANKAKEQTEITEEKPSFAGYKHFIVNNKTGKARKFKTIDELAKAQMSDDEQYMGLKGFRKFVDEALFGQSKRKAVSEVEAVAPEVQQNVQPPVASPELEEKAERLMELIKQRIPESIFKTIVSPIAKRQVIVSFAELIGVPQNQLGQLITNIKALSKPTTT